MLKINSYQFGEIQINEKIYTNDIIIFPDHIQANWWRKEGHRLASEDLNTILVHKPAIDLLLIGTGAYGAMKIPQSVTNHLHDLGIETINGFTKEICEKHNTLGDTKTIFATALHLTC
ncbi:MAG: MTH938/NDUFAF3 family protein [Candidatus Heimdallarchaeota archaeon]